MKDPIKVLSGKTFEEWVALFQEDPAEFERQRTYVLQKTIVDQKDPEKRAQLQRVIDTFNAHANGRPFNERISLATEMLTQSLTEVAAAHRVATEILVNALKG